MNEKPKITSASQLVDAVNRYRKMLCLHSSSGNLDSILKTGKMQRVKFIELIGKFDLLLFDAYGVLNRGSAPIEGAKEAVNVCFDRNIPCLVVSNNASEKPSRVWQKLQKMGFPFALEQIITSGLAVGPFVADSPYREQPYLLIGTADSASDYAPNPEQLLLNPPNGQDQIGKKPAYVLICSNRDYYGGLQQEVVEGWLARDPLPLLVANPDMVVQDDDGTPVVVAGYTADHLAKKFGCGVVGVGKPFSPVYQLALQHHPDIASNKILMVGDSLTTDILGGAAMGFSTCLTLSGLHGRDAANIEKVCEQWAIKPDYIVESIGA